MSRTDFIVIGGGINSLTIAALLGQAGKKVLLLEAREEVGGMASTVEFSSGFKCNIIHDSVKWIDPRVIEKLNLDAHRLLLHSPTVVRFALDSNGNHISFHRDPDETAASIKNHSDKDAKAWENFTKNINNLTLFLEKLYELTPPKLPNIGLKEAFSMRSMLSPIRKHGTRGLADFMRLAPKMMAELMDEWFESELLRAAVSTAGIHHLSFGPFAAGTGYNLLHQHVHSHGVFHQAQFVNGGTGELANAIKSSAESYHVELRTNTKVSAINLSNGVCTGVTLESGESIEAHCIVSGLDPHNTFMKLVGPSQLNPRFLTQLKNIKYRGSIARIHFALKGLPNIKGIPEDQLGSVFSVAPSVEYLERASDAVKYGRLPENPYVEFTLPSILNKGFAPEGKHVLSVTAQYAPYHLRGQQWSDVLKSQLKNNVVEVLENYIPEISSLIESSYILSPVDLETQFGLTEGNLNHGEMTLDQFFFMRPTMSTAQYKSPIDNLFLCGPGTHPGGGLHGTNGFNAAREMLK